MRKSKPEKFKDITDILSSNEFEKIERFTLKYGNRQTFRNIDNNNPHYKFGNFDIFFGPAFGLRGINNPAISDFNEMTILDWNSEINYYIIVIVRKCDLVKPQMRIYSNMQEGKVYLVDIYNSGIDKMLQKLGEYVKIMLQEISKSNFQTK